MGNLDASRKDKCSFDELNFEIVETTVQAIMKKKYFQLRWFSDLIDESLLEILVSCGHVGDGNNSMGNLFMMISCISTRKINSNRTGSCVLIISNP